MGTICTCRRAITRARSGSSIRPSAGSSTSSTPAGCHGAWSSITAGKARWWPMRTGSSTSFAEPLADAEHVAVGMVHLTHVPLVIAGGALDSKEGEPGPIMLQGDHGPVQYRNLVI